MLVGKRVLRIYRTTGPVNISEMENYMIEKRIFIFTKRVPSFSHKCCFHTGSGYLSLQGTTDAGEEMDREVLANDVSRPTPAFLLCLINSSKLLSFSRFGTVFSPHHLCFCYILNTLDGSKCGSHSSSQCIYGRVKVVPIDTAMIYKPYLIAEKGKRMRGVCAASAASLRLLRRL